jgi:hypothetical protein
MVLRENDRVVSRTIVEFEANGLQRDERVGLRRNAAQRSQWTDEDVNIWMPTWWALSEAPPVAIL